MKNRILALCLALIMAISLAGCKKEKKAAPATTPEQTTPEQTTLEQTTPPETTPEVTNITVPVDTNTVVPQDRVEGSYEQWLAAASIQVTTMLMYPDCQVEAVYALSETAFEKKMDSKGVVIHISDGGRSIWILSSPLENERSEPGTNDLKAAGIGFNTYDEVDPKNLPELAPLDIAALQPYIDQTLLPSIYMR